MNTPYQILAIAAEIVLNALVYVFVFLTGMRFGVAMCQREIDKIKNGKK